MSPLNLHTLWAGFLGLRDTQTSSRVWKGPAAPKEVCILGSADLVVAEAGQVCSHSREAEAQGVSFGSSSGLSPGISLGTRRTRATSPNSRRADPVWESDGVMWRQ